MELRRCDSFDVVRLQGCLGGRDRVTNSGMVPTALVT